MDDVAIGDLMRLFALLAHDPTVSILKRVN